MKKPIVFLCCLVIILSTAACAQAPRKAVPSGPVPVDTAAPAVAQPGDDPPPAPPEDAESAISLPFGIPLSNSVADLPDPPPLVTTGEGVLYIDSDHELRAAGIVPYYELFYEELCFPGTPLAEQIVVENNVRSVALSSMLSSLALMYTTLDGKLWEYGSLTSKTGEPSEARHIMDGVHAVAAGYQHVLALRFDGTLWGWGYFSGGRADTPVKIADEVIAATDCCFLKSDGTLWVLCENSDVNAGPGLAGVTPQRILDDVVFAGATSAIKADGTVWHWAEGASIPKAVKVFEGAIACGEDYVITADNRLIYWPAGFGSDSTAEITDDAVFAVRTCSAGSSKNAFVVLGKAGETAVCYLESE